MRKDDVIALPKAQIVDLDYRIAVEYVGIEQVAHMDSYSIRCHKSADSCKIMIPKKSDNSLTILKYKFSIVRASEDELVLKYIGKAAKKK